MRMGLFCVRRKGCILQGIFEEDYTRIKIYSIKKLVQIVLRGRVR